MNNIDFTWENYSALMAFLKKSYEDMSVPEAIECTAYQGRNLILRHDIDYSLERAVRMAEIEHEHGIRANYYVLMDSVYYNACEPTHIEALKNIINLGHHLGLHFNVGDYALQDYEPIVAAQTNMLQALLGYKITSISYHNPGKIGLDKLDRSDMIFGHYNAYAMKLQNHFSYRSDSLMTWKDKAFFDEARNGKHDNAYLLFHADWWTDEPMSMQQKIHSIIDNNADISRKQYADILRAYEGK